MPANKHGLCILSYPIKKGVLQNTSGGTLSGDFPPKTKMFSAENTSKIHRNQYFTTPPPEYLHYILHYLSVIIA